MYPLALILAMPFLFEFGHTQTTSSSLFQCQSSSQQNGLLYSPNIPDFYFNDSNAANFGTDGSANLTQTLSRKVTYIFTIPSESPLRNCSGTVVSLQYCYQARNRDRGRNRTVFNFLFLTQNSINNFTVIRNISIRTIPTNGKCTDPQNNIDQICCDNTSLSIYDRFQLPSSNFTFGIEISNVNVRPLAFTNSAIKYSVEQYQVAQGAANGPTINETTRVTNGSLLLRFFIDSGRPQTTSSPLFQCQSSSDRNGQVYTPNIPDFYFNDRNAAANFRTDGRANLTQSQARGVTYIFTVPPESPLRNCSGTVVSLQYCYQARNEDRGKNRTVFSILFLTRNGMSFRVNRRIFIRTIPSNSICTSRRMRQICCDNTTLRNFNRFQLPSSSVAFGVVITNGNVRPLAFTTSTSEYRIEYYRTSLLPLEILRPRTVLNLATSEQVNDSTLLLRFFIEPAVETTEEPIVTSSILLPTISNPPTPTQPPMTPIQPSITLTTTSTQPPISLITTFTEPPTISLITSSELLTTSSTTLPTTSHTSSTELPNTSSTTLPTTSHTSSTELPNTSSTNLPTTSHTSSTELPNTSSTISMVPPITSSTTSPTTSSELPTTSSTTLPTTSHTSSTELPNTSSTISMVPPITSSITSTTSPTTSSELPTTPSTSSSEVLPTASTRSLLISTLLLATPSQPPITQTSSKLMATKISSMNTTTGQLSPDTTIGNANIASPGTNISAVVGGAVGGCVAVILILAFIVFLVIVLVKRPSRQKLGIRERSSMAFQNAIYDGVDFDEGNDVKGLSITQPAFISNDYCYAGIEPQVRETNFKCQDSNYDCVKTHELPLSSKDEEDIYVVPAKEEDELYSQLIKISIKNLFRESIRLGDLLGSGQFGVVYKGVLQSPELGEVDVAVKTLREGSEEEDRVKFLQEAAIMGQFKHHNVVTMYGVVTDGEPILLILELLTKGDLRGHLFDMKSYDGEAVGVDDHTLLSYCRQVASGMAYLSNKAFVHRDLAARNILVSEDEICKIADFGMSRDLMNENYYISHGGKIPVKWTAPEALHYKKYSSASDVWSYGALMYEIWSVGHKPYEDYGNNDVVNMIDTGFRLPPPPGCPRTLYSIMISCWNPVTSERPNFSDISRQLSLPDTKLLQWSEEDRSVHPEATKLGADLLCGQELYKDLQTKYKLEQPAE